jgi:hypothetical protein
MSRPHVKSKTRGGGKSACRMTADPVFVPCPVEEGDELYPNGIFVFNITKMLDYIEKHPGSVELIEMAVADLDSGFSSLDETHIATVDINRPVVLAEMSPGRYNLIDGHHRVEKALRAGVKTMPVRRLFFPQHVPFLVSREAYKTYIEYWNDKVKGVPKLG